LAGIALLLAIVAVPDLGEVAGMVVAYAAIGVATAGVATTFAPVANSDRRQI